MTSASPETNAVASSSRIRQDNMPRAPRVNQIDADDLDEGLVQMLGDNVIQSVTNFNVSVLWVP
jgi:hypothetical protein